MLERSSTAKWLWWVLWLFWFAFIAQQVLDVARFDAPWPVWALRAVPLLLFMPSVRKDSLRGVVWLCFVLLFYFISSVELIFARPNDVIAVLGIVLVVALFSCATLYIRVRGRQLRLAVNDQQPTTKDYS